VGPRMGLRQFANMSPEGLIATRNRLFLMERIPNHGQRTAILERLLDVFPKGDYLGSIACGRQDPLCSFLYPDRQTFLHSHAVPSMSPDAYPTRTRVTEYSGQTEL